MAELSIEDRAKISEGIQAHWSQLWEGWLIDPARHFLYSGEFASDGYMQVRVEN